MKNHILIVTICCFCFFNYCNAQSKKEQIEQLSFKIDSLFNLTKNLNHNLDSIRDLNVKKDNLNDSCMNQISLLKSKNEIMINSFDEEKSKLSFQCNYLISQNSQLKDSLNAKDLSVDSKINIFEKSDFIDDSFNFSFNKNEEIDFPENQNLNGEFISFYPEEYQDAYSKNGKKIPYAKGLYKNGYKQDRWIYYLCNGEKQYEGYYLNGEKIGKWINYDFCHNTFDFQNIDFDYGYFSVLLTLKDYYNFFDDPQWDINREEIFYDNGIPSDTIYYFGPNNQIKLKLNWRTGIIFYENNQPLTNQKTTYEYPYFKATENKDLILYSNKGRLKYKLINKDKKIMQEFYNIKGNLEMICESSDNGVVNCKSYDKVGNITDTFEGGGKYGPECDCQ